MTWLRPLALAALLAVATLAACGDDDDETTPTPLPSTSATATPSAVTTATDGSATATGTPADTTAPPVTDPPSQTDPPSGVTLLTPVDKDHSLPAGYVPPGLTAISADYIVPGFSGQLRAEVVDAVIPMLDAAFTAGYDVRCRSAYRSYSEQESTFNYWVSVLGYDEAVRVSAMPGHSEHQLGATCDLTSPEVGWDLLESFGNTAPGQWLAAHAHEYGFALSYPEGKESTTGYSYEPWHFRYIGPAQAAAWKNSGLTLNQYLLQ